MSRIGKNQFRFRQEGCKSRRAYRVREEARIGKIDWSLSTGLGSPVANGHLW